MVLVPQADGSLQYDIIVCSEAGHEQVYRTQKLISGPRRGDATGRGIRVWVVVRLEGGVETGESAVLTEAWVDDYRSREGSIITQIKECASGDEIKGRCQGCPADGPHSWRCCR